MNEVILLRAMHTILHIALICLGLSMSMLAEDQDAIVVFYSHGSPLSTGLPGSKHGFFYGSIYDSNQRLVVFHDGFIAKNNRFIVFKLAPGPHTFSASYGSH